MDCTASPGKAFLEPSKVGAVVRGAGGAQQELFAEYGPDTVPINERSVQVFCLFFLSSLRPSPPLHTLFKRRLSSAWLLQAKLG
jgi:hypothetical protein